MYGFFSAQAVNAGALGYLLKLAKPVVPVQLYVVFVMFFAISKVALTIAYNNISKTCTSLHAKYFEKPPSECDFPVAQTMRSPRIIPEPLTSNFMTYEYNEESKEETEVDQVDHVDEEKVVEKLD